MRYTNFVNLLIINIVAAFAAEVPAQDPTPESIARRRFNLVYVKVIVPVTARIPHLDDLHRLQFEEGRSDFGSDAHEASQGASASSLKADLCRLNELCEELSQVH